MTRIRATCPSCGEVDLRPTDVELEIIRMPQDDESEVRDGSSYRFECPTCDDVVTKPADARIARLLATGGVDVIVTGGVMAPALPPHPEGPTSGPQFTYDDVLDFHLLLASSNVADLVLGDAKDHVNG